MALKLHAVLCVTLWYLSASLSEGSQKKGLAFHSPANACEDFAVLNNISWWYDWGGSTFYDQHPELPNCNHMTAVTNKFVPMVWGRHFHNITYHPNTQALLAFNEPNHKNQAHMTPEEAAQLWPNLEQHAVGIPLVSPAAAPCGSPTKCLGNTIEWFDRFFKACNNCRVDYLATHIYYCDAHHAMSVLHDLYRRYNRKIWLTEFACQHSQDPHKELQFMKAILPQLEGANYIHRYAWFMARLTKHSGFITSAASLLQPNSTQLTPLGRFYNNFQGTDATSIVG